MRMIEATLLIGHLRRIQGGNAGGVGSISALNYERDMKNERRANLDMHEEERDSILIICGDILAVNTTVP